MKTITNSDIFGTALEEEQVRYEAVFPSGPRLVIECSKKGINEREQEDAFSLSRRADTVVLKGGSSASLLQGISLLEIALKGGRLSDFLGSYTPRYPWRLILLSEQESFTSSERICRSLIRLGYNGAILSNPESLMQLRARGLKGIFKLDGSQLHGLCFLDERWKHQIDEMIEALPEVDGVLFEGSYLSLELRRHPKSRDFLESDLALQELRCLEERLKGRCPLIYVLPYHSSLEWVPEFLDEVGNDTMVSFSAVSGDPSQDHLAPHPLWELLHRSPDISGTPLLPLINGGSIGQGEGLWPTVPLDLIEKSLCSMRRHPFGGAIVLAHAIPSPGSFLDAGLWVAGQSLRNLREGALSPEVFPRVLFESWCAAYHPECFQSELFEEVRRLVKQLSALRAEALPASSLLASYSKNSSEEGRLFSDSIMADLNRLQWMAAQIEGKDSPSFKDYLSFFIRDAKRQVLHFLQTHHLPSLYVLSQDDQKEAFWTEMVSGRAVGFSSSGKAALLEKPNCGEKGSALRQIYEETGRIIPFRALREDSKE